jgi:type III pantothenate kinase
MLLLIDAGNTRVKWALAHEDAELGTWQASGALFHAELDALGDDQWLPRSEPAGL